MKLGGKLLSHLKTRVLHCPGQLLELIGGQHAANRNGLDHSEDSHSARKPYPAPLCRTFKAKACIKNPKRSTFYMVSLLNLLPNQPIYLASGASGTSPALFRTSNRNSNDCLTSLIASDESSSVVLAWPVSIRLNALMASACINTRDQ